MHDVNSVQFLSDACAAHVQSHKAVVVMAKVYTSTIKVQDFDVVSCGRTGDKAGGCVRALYDPTLSERGVLLCAARKPRAKDPLDFEVSSQPWNCAQCIAMRCSTVDVAALCLCMLSIFPDRFSQGGQAAACVLPSL